MDDLLDFLLQRQIESGIDIVATVEEILAAEQRRELIDHILHKVRSLNMMGLAVGFKDKLLALGLGGSRLLWRDHPQLDHRLQDHLLTSQGRRLIDRWIIV